MICVLDVIEGPAKGKRIWLKENECLEVGRVSSTDFSIPMDSHLSRRHLLLDSTQNGFRVRDVGSANGTYLNNERVTVRELCDGDRIRAGMSTFLVTFRKSGENPHERDGISFNNSMKSYPESFPTLSPNQVVEDVADHQSNAAKTRTLDFCDRVDLELTVKITAEEFRDAQTGDPPPDELIIQNARIVAARAVAAQTVAAQTVVAQTVVAQAVVAQAAVAQAVVAQAAVDQAVVAQPEPAQPEPAQAEPAQAEEAPLIQKSPDKALWWNAFFTPTPSPNLLEQSQPFFDPQGDFVGLLKSFAKSYRLSLVINQGQLHQTGLELIERLRPTGAVESLSRTLVYFDVSKLVDPWSLVYVCVNQDAIICIGSNGPPTMKDWVPFANSLSYPSMLLCHIRNPSSEISRWLLSNNSLALFELERDGKLGLFIKNQP